MVRYLLRSLSVAGFFSIMLVAFAGAPATAGSVHNAVYSPGAGNLYTEAGWRGRKWNRRSARRHRGYRRHHSRRHQSRRHHFSRPRYRYRHHRRHRNYGAAFGLGLLGGALLSQPYVGSYATRRGYCHVHRYRVRGMTFHRDVRCFKHRNWRHPSISYVR